MRKISPEAVRDDFLNQLRDLSAFHRVGFTAFATEADQSTLTEHSLLAAAVIWEGFVSDMFIAFINRDAIRFKQHLRDAFDAHLNSASKPRLVFDSFGALDLAKSTQRTWGSELNRIEQKWKDTPLSVWNDPRMAGKVMGWRNSRSSTPRSADFGVTVLRALLKFGRLSGRLSINVAADIPQLYKAGSRAEIVWSEEDIEAFDRSASELGARHVYLAVKLAALTGLRREDLVTLRWEEIKDHAIVKKALKASRGKRRIATIPKLPVLQELLDVLASLARKEGVDTVLVNLHGKPWTADGFGTSFIRVRDHAKITHFDPDTGETKSKHLHDLRGTFCTKLILAGLTDQEAANIMGWSPQQVPGIRRTYVDQSSVAVAIGRRLKGHL